MSRHAPAELLAIGMVTPIGLCAAQTAASVRAGISRLSESEVYDRHGNPLVMGLADDRQLPPLVASLAGRGLSVRHERLARLGGPALAEALAAQEAGVPPLLLGIAEARAEAQHPLGRELLEILSTQAGADLDLPRSRIYPSGRAAGLLALDDALTLLDRREAACVVVGAIDSYFDIGLLEALDREGRLHSSGRASDGFVPGEGAAFLLIGPVASGRRDGRRPLARIAGLARAVEPGHLYSQEPHRGEGLAATFRAVFEAVPARRETGSVTCVYAGLNGESFWAKEWGVAQIRSADRFAKPCRIVHPVDRMGDPGAALGPVMVGLAALDLGRDRDAGSSLVWCSSDRDDRAAALLVRWSDR